MTDASSKNDVRRLKVGGGGGVSIPCSQSIAISVSVNRQWRHFGRTQGV